MENFLVKKKELLNNNRTPLPINSKDGISLDLAWITNCRASEVINMRNEERVLRSTGKKEKITADDHSEFISNYFEQNRLDFIIKEKSEDKYIGGVNFVKTNFGWEIGKYIGNKNFEGRGIAKRATESLIFFVSKEFQFIDEIYAKTKIKNFTNIKLNEKLGFRTERILDADFLLMKKFL